MKSEKYFDHILGDQDSKVNKDELKMFKRIINAHVQDYSEAERMNFQRIGVHLRMKEYVSSPIKKIITTGAFLNELLTIYKIKKVKFAEVIDYEKHKSSRCIKRTKKTK